jgi:hypothetical protein
MVKNFLNQKTAKPGMLSRAVFTSVGLAVISAAVAVLGAPTKW